jgi:DNA-binding MarR family transcriptional regulator
MGDDGQRTPGRRSPTADELATWRNYVETSEVVRRSLAAALQSASGISDGDYRVMLALSEAPDRTRRSAELADEVGWERSRLSHHLRRMEERGLVTRDRVGPDARGTAVTLSAEGVRLYRSSSAAHLRAVRQVFVDAFTPEEFAAVRVVTGALRRHQATGLPDRAQADLT